MEAHTCKAAFNFWLHFFFQYLFPDIFSHTVDLDSLHFLSTDLVEDGNVFLVMVMLGEKSDGGGGGDDGGDGDVFLCLYAFLFL